jgi:hypothetical protein
MRGMSGMIALTLSALLMGGCATRPDAMHDRRDSPYENTDRPIVPYENDNRPIMARDFGGELNSPWQGPRVRTECGPRTCFTTLPSSQPRTWPSLTRPSAGWMNRERRA